MVRESNTLCLRLARPGDVADDPESVCYHPLIERRTSHIRLLCLAPLSCQHLQDVKEKKPIRFRPIDNRHALPS